MASSRGPSQATLSISPNHNFDTLDMEQFINFDHSHVLPTQSYSPELARSASISTPNPSMEYIDNPHLAPSPQQTFAAPSHQYELHKQQTGLPVGALANTFAINQADHMVYGHAERMLGSNLSDGYSGDLFDFNTAPYRSMGSDMDLDFNSPLDVPSHYVDPTTVSGQESSVSSMPTKQRAWPGMHQRQAAMKAQAEAQQQQQQQQQQKQQSAIHQRNASASQQSTQRPLVNAPLAKDPIVEERISRLLNQMRHENVSSSNNDDTATPTAQGGSAHLGRSRKDEEDMDEDERLLASEEGKKLSSKERRQLRNKVSARAFRSRRKGMSPRGGPAGH